MNLPSYQAHIQSLLTEWRELMRPLEFSAVVVHAGANPYFYGDDQNPPFHAFGHFLRWIPHSDCEHAVVLAPDSGQPILFWHESTDYWYLASEPPAFCDGVFDVRVFSDPDKLQAAVREEARAYEHVAILGPHAESISASTQPDAMARLGRQLDFHRAYKTEFESACMQLATNIAVRGHRAARSAFYGGASEYEIQLEYLRASQQTEAELPYPSIIGINEHAAVLHYQKYARRNPTQVNSLLIDAGAKAHCYHSDITRTYAAEGNDEFADLVSAVDAAQQKLIAGIEICATYLALHEAMHHAVSEILCQVEILSCSPEAAFAQRMTDAFFPHGLGHLVGLQTHDVGGHVVAPNGDETEPHERYESLRLLRTVEPRMVFTIEPGIYFIRSLLGEWHASKDFNWPKIERLMSSGGVRIEDNVLITQSGVTNLTREAFNADDADGRAASSAI